jgi:prepilin-type N-terminal cleavage/methylation domain-containing protein
MKIFKHTPARNLCAYAKKGFTLIEIMVATVIMVVLVGLVIQITSEVLNVWNRSSGKLAANAEARIAMDLLTQDLETAVYRNNGMQWLRAENEGVIGPSGNLEDATVALRLFSPALDRPDGPGDICAIAYKLDYRNPITGAQGGGDPDDRLFILYRLVVSPQQTFNDLMGAENDQVLLPGKGSPTWGQNIVGTEGGNYLVSNIVKFNVDFYVQDDGDSGTPTPVPGDTIFGGTDATVGSGATSEPAHFQKPLAYAEITLTVISDEGASLLQNIGRINENVDSVIQQYGEVFTRRVNFLARPF